MANTILVQVADLATVLTTYDKIKVYKSATINGIYTEITTVSTRIAMNAIDSLYDYVDSTGLSTDYYKTSYFNSSSSIESGLSAAISAVSDGSQLLENMLVTITLSKDIKSNSGLLLNTDQEFFFTTTYKPLYSSIRKVRLEVGSFIKNVSDDTINLAIFEASLAANQLSFATGSVGTNSLFLFARREWTTCKAAEMLLMNNLGSGGLRSKRLDNFEVTYDANQGADILKKIQDCLLRWEGQLISGGEATQLPQAVVKGDLDVDAPNVGRMWEKGPGVANWPGINLRYRPVGVSRRYLGGWRRRGHGDD